MSRGPNLFGLLTLSVPMLLAGVLLYPWLLIVGVVLPQARKLRDQVRIIVRANYNLIHHKAFFPMFRCKVAGTLFGLSPRLSGLMYRSFNLLVFLLIWLGILLPVWAWVS